MAKLAPAAETTIAITFLVTNLELLRQLLFIFCGLNSTTTIDLHAMNSFVKTIQSIPYRQVDGKQSPQPEG